MTISLVSSEQQVSHSSTEASSSPVIGNAALPLGEVKLKKVAPKVAPPPKQEPPSFDNELLAKLKKRQVTIDQPAPPTNQQESEQVVEVPVETPSSQPQPSVSKSLEIIIFTYLSHSHLQNQLQKRNQNQQNQNKKNQNKKIKRSNLNNLLGKKRLLDVKLKEKGKKKSKEKRK